MKTSLSAALLILAFLLSATPIACMYLFSEVMVSKTRQSAISQLQEATLANAIRMTSDFSRMCELIQISDNSYSESVQRTFSEALNKLGKPTLTKDFFEREIREQNNTQD